MGDAKRRKAAGQYPAQTSKPAAQALPAMAELLDWHVVGDASAHPRTADLLSALAKLKGRMSDLGGSAMVAALETSSQEPVVLVRTQGFRNWMDVIGVFQDLGLTDRLETALVSVNGLDAAFS